MKKLFIGTCLIILFILAGAVVFFVLHPKRALKVVFPSVNKVEKIHVGFNGDTALIDSYLKLKNESFFELSIDSLIYDVKLDTNKLLSKAQYLNLHLKRGEIDTIKLPLIFNFKNLINQLRHLRHLRNQDSVRLQLNARVVYETFFGNVTVPVKKELLLEVPVPPELDVEKLRYNKWAKGVFYFDAFVAIDNPGKLDLKLSAIQYTLIAKDNFTAKGHYLEDIRIKPRSKLTVKLPLNAKFEHPFKTALNILTDKDMVNYYIRITSLVTMDKVSKEKTKIEIEKHGKTELKK